MNVIFLFLIWPTILLMVFLTHRVKRRSILWIFILTPPLSLLSLWWIPLARNSMHLIWVPAIIAMYISIFSSLLRICIIVQEWKNRATEKGRIRLIKLVRPVMMVLIIGSIAARERIANDLFGKYTGELGLRIQEICDLEGKCPKTIEGWDIIEENPNLCVSGSFVTKLGRKASVRYESKIRDNKFEIIVIHTDLSFYNIRGGVRTNLKTKGDGQSIDVGSEQIFDEEEQKLMKEVMEKIREYKERENKRSGLN